MSTQAVAPTRPLLTLRSLTRVGLATVVLIVAALVRNWVLPPVGSVEAIGDDVARLALVAFLASLIWAALVVTLFRVTWRVIARSISFGGGWAIIHVGDLPVRAFGRSAATLFVTSLILGVGVALLYELITRVWPGAPRRAA